MKIQYLPVALIFIIGKAYPGCTAPTIDRRKDVVETVLKNIKEKMENDDDEIVWGKIDSIKDLNVPKDLFYEGYNVGEESKIIELSEILQRRNPYLSAFKRQYVWFFTVRSKRFVYRGQIGKVGSECSEEYLVKPGLDIPFVKSNKTGALKEIEYFYQFRGYQMIPGNEIHGKIALRVVWPDAPALDNFDKK